MVIVLEEAQRALLDREYKRREPRQPERVYHVDSAAKLPSAADYPFCLIFAVWIKRLAVSDGVNWIRQDNGAVL